MKKTNQQEAFEYISTTFQKSVLADENISYEFRKDIIAGWEDISQDPIIGTHLLQAVTNFLWEVDGKLEAARKAGIVMALTRLELVYGINPTPEQQATIRELENLLKEESAAEEQEVSDVGELDLSEVGGNDEDDTPLV